MLHRNNKTYLTSDRTLKIGKSGPADHGLDNFGYYQQYEFNLTAVDNSIGMEIYFKIYSKRNFVIFGQRFNQSYDGISVGNPDKVANAFPFRVSNYYL